MQVGREIDSKDALIKLRGESNMDIVETEFNRISLNLKAQQKERGTDFLSTFMLLMVVQTYLQLPLRQWDASNVYLLVLSSWKLNFAENHIAKLSKFWVAIIESCVMNEEFHFE